MSEETLCILYLLKADKVEANPVPKKWICSTFKSFQREA